MKKWLILLLVVIAASCCLPTVQAQDNLPPVPTASIYVQDFAGVISADGKAKINQVGADLAAKTKAQVVVVTVKSTEGQPIEEVGLGILRKWGIGDKTLNNGVLMLIAVNDRQSRIEVGYGLEGALPDAKTGEIQDQYMIPYFKNNDYDQGILNGYWALVGQVAKEYNVELVRPTANAPPSTNSSPVEQSMPWWLQVLLVVGAIVLLLIDWIFFGGFLTGLLLSILLRRGGGGSGSSGGSYGGGSGGGGGSSRGW